MNCSSHEGCRTHQIHCGPSGSVPVYGRRTKQLLLWARGGDLGPRDDALVMIFLIFESAQPTEQNQSEPSPCFAPEQGKIFHFCIFVCIFCSHFLLAFFVCIFCSHFLFAFFACSYFAKTEQLTTIFTRTSLTLNLPIPRSSKPIR